MYMQQLPECDPGDIAISGSGLYLQHPQLIFIAQQICDQKPLIAHGSRKCPSLEKASQE